MPSVLSGCCQITTTILPAPAITSTLAVGQGPAGPPGDSRLPDPATVPDYYTFAAIGGEYVTVPFPSGSGDMQSLIYDPRGIAADAFNLSNLTGNIDGGVFT